MAGDMHGKRCAWQGGHVWQGVCIAQEHAWQGGMCDGGACMAGGMHGRRNSHCSGQYTSCWNVFLLFLLFTMKFRQGNVFTPVCHSVHMG